MLLTLNKSYDRMVFVIFVCSISRSFIILLYTDLVRCIHDPEHPLTLEELNVLQEGHIEVSDTESTVTVSFTPTIPHCSMATLIGLSIRVRLIRALPERFKVRNYVSTNTHVIGHVLHMYNYLFR